MLALVTLFTAFLLVACWVPRDPGKCNFIGALIGGAAALIGGRKNRKAQQIANDQNRPASQVAQWEQAGINPLFGLSSGAYVPQQAASMGDAYAIAGSKFGQAFDQMGEQKEQNLRETNLELQNDKLRAQLDKLADPSEPSYMAQYGGFLPLPSFGGRNAGRNIQTVSGAPAGAVPSLSAPVEIGAVTVTHPGDLGRQSWVNPRVKDAEMSEARYGDLAQEATGVYNLVSDNWYNGKLQDVSNQFGRSVADAVHLEFAKGDARSLDEIIRELTPSQTVQGEQGSSFGPDYAPFLDPVNRLGSGYVPPLGALRPRSRPVPDVPVAPAVQVRPANVPKRFMSSPSPFFKN